MNELGVDDSWLVREIKLNPITEEELTQMKNLAGSYTSLFSKRAIKYRSLGLKDKNLNEKEIKNYILDEYTFLKRPVVIIGQNIFIGSAKSNVAQIKAAL